MKIRNFFNKAFGCLKVYLDEAGEPWFLAKEVCEKLGHDASHIAKDVLEEDRRRVNISELRFELALNASSNSSGRGGARTLYLVSEAGMYDLILSSRKPEAKEFQRWVTHSVLPSIRKNGGYIEGQENLSEKEKVVLVEDIRALSEKITRLQKRRHELIKENKIAEEKIKKFKYRVKKLEQYLSDTEEMYEKIRVERDAIADKLDRFILPERKSVDKPIASLSKKRIPESDDIIKVDNQGFVIF